MEGTASTGVMATPSRRRLGIRIEHAVPTARFVAVGLALVMIHYFLTTDAIRSGNAFLVPDALVTVLLIGSALCPRRLAVPAMIFAFAWAAAVWTVSLSTYAVRGEFSAGVNHLALITPAVLVAGWLAYVVRRGMRQG